MPSKGHDGGEMPGMGEPIMEMPLGVIGMEALNPTLAVMQNLPSIASLASTLVEFIKDNDHEDELLQWMYRTMCENHREELPVADIPEILEKYKELLDVYLHTLGISGDTSGCSHE
jgi:hypothetical protein